MLLVNTERKEFNTEEISRGTLIYAKHKSWPEGQTGMVTEVSGNELRVQYLPSIQNVLNHFLITVAEAEAGEWDIRYSSDGLQSVASFPEEMPAPEEPKEESEEKSEAEEDLENPKEEGEESESE